MIQGCSPEVFIIWEQTHFPYDCNVTMKRQTRDRHKIRVLHTGTIHLDDIHCFGMNISSSEEDIYFWKVDKKKNEEGSTDFTPTSTKVVHSTVFFFVAKNNTTRMKDLPHSIGDDKRKFRSLSFLEQPRSLQSFNMECFQLAPLVQCLPPRSCLHKLLKLFKSSRYIRLLLRYVYDGATDDTAC